MSPEAALVVVLSAVIATALLGTLWRSRQGLRRGVQPGLVYSAGDLGSELPLGPRGTVVLFRSATCSQCPSARRIIADRLTSTAGIASVEVDLSEATDLAASLRILQTPTIFVLDRDGLLLGRIGGVPRPAELDALIAPLREGTLSRVH